MKKALAIGLAAAMAVTMTAPVYASDDSESGKGIAKEDLKIGAIYIGDENEGYTAAHMAGIDEMQEALGLDDSQVIEKTLIGEDEGCYDAAADLADQGCQIIFANQAVNGNKFDLLVSLRNVKNVPFYQNTIFIVAIFIVVLIAILYWFFGTELGCSLRATGCNPNMSRAQGINTDVCKVLGLMISNGLVALSSALLAQYQGFADVNMGRGAIVIGLAAVIIGEAIFGKIFHNFALRLLSVAFGSILYYLVLQTVIWMGIDTDLLKMLSALVVAVFLAVPYWKAKYFSKPVKRGGNK